MIGSLRKYSRRIIANGLYYSGLLWLLASIRLRNEACVLMYHRVLPDGADTFSADGIVVRTQTFARQMAFLQRHFTVLSVGELTQYLESGRKLPPRSCVVTFDDGWRDNFEHALPILREHDVPAAIFMATDYIGSEDCFWQERLSRQLFTAVHAGGDARALAEQTVNHPGLTALDTAAQRDVIRNAIDGLKRQSTAEILALERRLQAALTGDAVKNLGDDRFMNWEQVVGLIKGTRVTVGSHGCSHTPLTQLPEERTATELTEAGKRIADVIGKPTTSIAYPNGNHNDTVIRLARAAGYRIGFTTEKGFVGAHQDPLRLPRINIYQGVSNTMPDFLCAILLVFKRLRRSPAPNVNAHTRHG